MALIVVAPESERENLRNAGVLPPGLFHDFSEEDDGSDLLSSLSVYLWPYSIDYSAGTELVAHMNERPPDIPLFFGIQPADNDSARMANERLVARLLHGIVVHVVFLEKDDKDSQRPRYAHFRSFAEITKWSNAFKCALSARFTNEAEFQRAENVLVIVSRGEQAQATKEELDEFASCFGEGQAFCSCYFLDFTLQAGETGHLFHSPIVWDIAVARLILAFLLSEENAERNQAPDSQFWRKPGIRIWRALECRALISSDIRDAAIKNFGKAIEALQGQLGADVAAATPPTRPSVDLSGLPLLEPSDTMEPGWRKLPSGGWSDFDATACETKTKDDGRWEDSFSKVAGNYKKWLVEHPAESGRKDQRGSFADDASSRFRSIHSDPRKLFAERRALLRALDEANGEIKKDFSDDGKTDPLARMWANVTEITKNRCEVGKRLQQERIDFSLARAHYVGWSSGLLVVSAVSCLCGWVLFRIVNALGASSLYALLFGGATFLGAFLACFAILRLHSRAGTNGALALAATSKYMDQLVVERDNAVRELVAKSLLMGRYERLRALFFRAWALMNRTERILLSELKPTAAAVAIDENAGDEKASGNQNTREVFIHLTTGGIGDVKSNAPFSVLTHEDGGLKNVIDAWWNASNDIVVSPEFCPRESFNALWVRLCKQDEEDAGYFPAKLFSSEIAAFVRDFSDALRRFATSRAREKFGVDIKENLNRWLEDRVVGASPNEFASAAFTSMHAREAQWRTGHAWFVDDDRSVDMDNLENTARQFGHSFEIVIKRSSLLKQLPQLGFFFQEFDVGLQCEKATGRLLVTEAPNG